MADYPNDQMDINRMLEVMEALDYTRFRAAEKLSSIWSFDDYVAKHLSP